MTHQSLQHGWNHQLQRKHWMEGRCPDLISNPQGKSQTHGTKSWAETDHSGSALAPEMKPTD